MPWRSWSMQKECSNSWKKTFDRSRRGWLYQLEMDFSIQYNPIHLIFGPGSRGEERCRPIGIYKYIFVPGMGSLLFFLEAFPLPAARYVAGHAPRWLGVTPDQWSVDAVDLAEHSASCGCSWTLNYCEGIWNNAGFVKSLWQRTHNTRCFLLLS